MGVKSFVVKLLPFVAMVAVETFAVGLTTLSKAAMSTGLSHFVFVVYSNVIASLILLPYYFIIIRITLMQNCVTTGINYSSPTLASAMGNLTPAFTFLLAAIFRMEKSDFRSLGSQVKILGTLVSILGALIVTLYKGPAIGAVPQLQPSSSTVVTTTNDWVIGGIFLATASLSVAILNVSQAAILKGYPSEMTLVTFCCFFGTIQCTIISLIGERNPDAWKIRPDIELISVVYAAVFGNLVICGVTAWCIRRKGPVFVAMFKPVGISIAAFMGAIFLGDTLHIGSVIGAIIIVVGFYGVIWAQSKEEESKGEKYDRQQVSSQKTPLLESHINV
ncbi:WAT1-related protein At3g28050-like isoform X2 [Mangifera indica]|uniref:WAT1-related protein At3g28050-like isoform X2 n=1 Tax=Mangifera indica TaxID=29780 RepID=UPI001CFB59A5|nr:WAT1-related protein At3g28050-like isoform X2 [Mangifera indica]